MALSVLCSIFLSVCFKLFPKYGIDTFPAIVFNYLTCVFTAWILEGCIPIHAGLADHGWFPYGIILGFVFITGFNCNANTVQISGIGVTSVIQKMSMFLSVIFAYLYFRESMGPWKIVGLIAAVPATLLVNNIGFGTKIKLPEFKFWMFPLGTFIINGVIDSIFFFLKKKGIVSTDDLAFSSFLFLMAALVGICFWLAFGKRLKLGTVSRRNILAGIILGVPNFYSIYWLLKGLAAFAEGSVVIPLYNISTLLCTLLVGILLFSESLNRKKSWGIVFAVISIVCVSLLA
ncbi:MAG: EamA family transporter [Saprospiraceae bacterium]